MLSLLASWLLRIYQIFQSQPFLCLYSQNTRIFQRLINFMNFDVCHFEICLIVNCFTTALLPLNFFFTFWHLRYSLPCRTYREIIIFRKRIKPNSKCFNGLLVIPISWCFFYFEYVFYFEFWLILLVNLSFFFFYCFFNFVYFLTFFNHFPSFFLFMFENFIFFPRGRSDDFR